MSNKRQVVEPGLEGRPHIRWWCSSPQIEPNVFVITSVFDRLGNQYPSTGIGHCCLLRNSSVREHNSADNGDGGNLLSTLETQVFSSVRHCKLTSVLVQIFCICLSHCWREIQGSSSNQVSLQDLRLLLSVFSILETHSSVLFQSSLDLPLFAYNPFPNSTPYLQLNSCSQSLQWSQQLLNAVPEVATREA